jgi:uncharacterized membrane protein
MEESLVAILCIAVIGLAIKLSRLSDASATIAGLIDLTRRLEQRLGTLERQVARLADNPSPAEPRQASPPLQTAPSVLATAAVPQELNISQADFVVPANIAPATAPEPVAAAHAPPPPRLHPAVPPHQPAPRPAARSISLEERLGQNWLSKIGIVLVVLGVATFLGYKLVTLGPLGKSLTGLATAVILLGGGVLLERKPNYRIFARAGIGGGWALLFFTTFALYHVEAMQVLTSQTADLVLMALVASAMVWHSLRYKSQVVTALAFLLAFATVGISHVTLFSLVAGAILAAALVCVAAREYWFELGLAGLCGVYLNHFIWLLRVLPEGGVIGHPFPEFFASAGLLLLYWLLFRLFYILRAPQDPHQELIASITAVLNSIGLLALLKYQSSHPEWAFRALLVLGTVEFLFAFVARPRRRAAFLVLSTLASALLLAAIPFRFAGSNWTLLWLFEAEALFVAGILIKEKALRRLGLIAGFLAALQLLFIDTLPILGRRLAAADAAPHTSVAIALVAAALFFWSNSEYAGRRWSGLFEELFDETALAVTSYLAAIAMAGALWILLPDHWLTVAWGALALVLFELGILFRTGSLRNQGYAVLAASFIRIFLYDLNIGFVGSGPASPDHHIYIVIPLIAASIWIYHRTQTALAGSPSDRAAGVLAVWLGAAATTALLYLELRPELIAIGWSLLALVLITAAWLLGRSIFTAQALVLLGASAARALAFNLFLAAGPAAPFWSTRAATIGGACVVMLCCLPMAFAVRRGRLAHPPSSDAPAQDPWPLLLTRPEQPFFFVPYALLAILIAFELRTGMITLGWIALGLAAFLAALPIGERSYRLAGLGLLLFGLAKIVLVDVWSLSTTDRILTLIATGAALLLVSFLYSRYRETILKFL